MTVVMIECNGAAFLTSFQEGSQFQNSASKIANCIIVYIVNSHLIIGKLLATHS